MQLLDPYGAGGEIPLPAVTLRNRRGTSAQWVESNYVLEEGEIGVELDTGQFKLGNGVTPWLSLDYFIPSEEIMSRIDYAVAVGQSNLETLGDHINSPNPHPVYDDAPSLVLIYQNAKV